MKYVKLAVKILLVIVVVFIFTIDMIGCGNKTSWEEMGLPEDNALRDMGYEPEEVNRMMEMSEYHDFIIPEDR